LTRRTDIEVIDYRDRLPGISYTAFCTPLSLLLDITARCQCRCWFCYNDSGTARPDELSKMEIRQIIRRFAQIGGMELRLSGGEPTLHPDLPDFINLAGQLDLKTILVSNGLIADSLLERLKHSPVTNYYLSIQGDPETQDAMRGSGSYHRCLKSAKTLLEAGAAVRLSVVFHKQNRHCVEHLVKAAAKLGANIAFNPLRPLGKANIENILSPSENRSLVERIAALRKEYPHIRIDTPWDYLASPPVPQPAGAYKRLGCGKSGLSVTASGDCFGCGQLSTRPEFSLGNVRKDDLHTIWLRSRSSCPVANAPLNAKCRSCPYLYGSACFGGCMATAMMVRGDPDARDPYCYVDQFEGITQP
jgi:radical SAM protein with 4Fe4S-binding SPASM domain